MCVLPTGCSKSDLTLSRAIHSCVVSHMSSHKCILKTRAKLPCLLELILLIDHRSLLVIPTHWAPHRYMCQSMCQIEFPTRNGHGDSKTGWWLVVCEVTDLWRGHLGRSLWPMFQLQSRQVCLFDHTPLAWLDASQTHATHITHQLEKCKCPSHKINLDPILSSMPQGAIQLR